MVLAVVDAQWIEVSEEYTRCFEHYGKDYRSLPLLPMPLRCAPMDVQSLHAVSCRWHESEVLHLDTLPHNQAAVCIWSK